MTEREREARRLRLFLARLECERETAEQVYGRVREAAGRVQGPAPDPVSVAAVALYLQNLYTALESLLQRIAAELDGAVPTGEGWHRELLGQMALEIADVRPRVVDAGLRSDLDLLRRFRHIVRYAYALEYDWDEMQSALAAADRAMEALPNALSQLEATVRAAIAECERPE